MNKNLQNFRDNFIEKMGFLGSLFGFSKLLGQIYGVLYLSPNPVSLNELMEELKVSKGSVSTNIRELEKWGGCRKVWVKGDRKDFYEAETNFKNIINKRLIDAVRRRLATAAEITDVSKNVMNDSEKKFTESEKKLFDFYQSRILRIDGIRKKAELALNTFTKFL